MIKEDIADLSFEQLLDLGQRELFDGLILAGSNGIRQKLYYVLGAYTRWQQAHIKVEAISLKDELETRLKKDFPDAVIKLDETSSFKFTVNGKETRTVWNTNSDIKRDAIFDEIYLSIKNEIAQWIELHTWLQHKKEVEEPEYSACISL